MMRSCLRLGALVGVGVIGLMAMTDDAAAQFQKAPGAFTSQLPSQPPASPAAGQVQGQAQQLQVAPPQPITKSIANVTVSDMRRGGAVSVSGSLEGAPVLAGFRFRFTHGDHELRQVGLLTLSASSVDATYFDKNYDDPFRLSASYIVLKGGGLTRGTVTAYGDGQFEIPLPNNRPPNTKLVLSGFQIWRSNEDRHVQVIGVWALETRNSIRVTFGDGSSSVMDWRKAKGQLPLGDAGLVGTDQGGIPYRRGTLGGVVADAAAAENGVRALKSRKVDDPYAVQVQYSYIPSTTIEGTDESFTGTSRKPDSGKTFPARGGLVGFEFLFDNKDHHLKSLGVIPPLPGGAVAQWWPADESIAFEDQNRDDPIKWAVKFVKIKP